MWMNRLDFLHKFLFLDDLTTGTLTFPLKYMSKSCILTGKKTSVGNHVSHSKRRVKRKLHANLSKRRIMNPATGRTVTVTISTRGLRTLKKWNREGKAYDLAAIKKEAALS